MKVINFCLLLFFCAGAFALDVPELTGPVVDQANIIGSKRRTELNEFLLKVDRESSAQIAVLTIKSLNGNSLEEYALRVAREWGLGDEKTDKGVLLLVAFEEKKIRIEVGYGAEGDLTDAKCGMIIRNIIAPQFQYGKYGEGIQNGVKAIASVVAGDSETAASELKAGDEIDWVAVVALTIFFSLYFIMFTGSLAVKFRILQWLPWASFFVRHASNPSRHSSGVHFSGGFSGGSFGGSSGGFGGGGGGFGGGGASGGW